MDDLAVSVEDLHFSHGAQPVLAGLNLQVAQREIFGVLGADGQGKSTLLRLLVGQLDPSAGRISVLGMARADPRLRDAVAYMPQTFGQYLDLSVLENLTFFGALHGLAREEAARVMADLLARTGLKGFEHRRAAQLSGGMMQKLALACALVSRPRVMFLDEPTTGVDPLSRRAFWQLLEGVRAEGVAIVYATSNMEEAERCDRVATLEGGRFSREGRPPDLVSTVGATLFNVSGEGVRAWRTRLQGVSGVEFVFPVGLALKVWMAGTVAADALAARLADLAPQLRTELSEPCLHDVVLRELALAQRGHAHGRA